MAGYPQSVNALLECGAEAARRAGISRPNASHKIHYGLAETARIDPKPLDRDAAMRTIKSVLFDIETDCEPIAPELLPIIEERGLTAIWPHLEDKTAVFNDWFWGRHNSFVKQIAQKKTAPGGELDRDVVERYLLQKGWEAYEYVGHCVFAWAKDMAEAMPRPLTRNERTAFALLYSCLPEFGGIPLILLAEKLWFVAPVLEDIVSNPSSNRPIQVLYRLLQFYSIMVSNRRKADVRRHEVAKAASKRLRKETGQKVSADEATVSPMHEDRVADRDRRNTYFARLATARKITCKCRQARWDVNVELVEDTHDFQLTFTCERCGTAKLVTLSVANLEKFEMGPEK